MNTRVLHLYHLYANPENPSHDAVAEVNHPSCLIPASQLVEETEGTAIGALQQRDAVISKRIRSGYYTHPSITDYISRQLGQILEKTAP